MRRASAAVLAGALAAACGHKGPPLPPFVRVPAAPADMKIARRADTVELEFTIPAANTDGTRPANIERVDVYGFAGPDIRDEDLLKRGPKIASLAVKAPRDPDATVEPDESAADLDPLVGGGLDQGARAHVRQPLNPALLVPPRLVNKPKKPAVDEGDTPSVRPLLGPPAAVPSLTFVAVGVSTSGRTGGVSRRVYAPLVPPPPPPSSPRVEYDEKSITVTWSPPALLAPAQSAADGQADAKTKTGQLESRPLWYPRPSIAYYVYEVPPEGRTPPGGGASPPEKRLNESPIAVPQYTDNRMDWGTERCYAVRTVETIAGQSVESAAAPPACRKLVDTFPPAPPRGVTAVAGEKLINLIWQPNGEKDLAGYIVLRGASADALKPITSTLMQETIFKDAVPTGAHYFYAVKAVDKAGNESGASEPDQATAR